MDKIHYHAQLERSDKGRELKGLVFAIFVIALGPTTETFYSAHNNDVILAYY